MKTLFVLLAVSISIFLFCGLAGSNPIPGSSMPIGDTDMHSLDEISRPSSKIENEETPIEKSDFHSLQDLSEGLPDVEEEENFEDQEGAQPRTVADE